MTNYKEKGEWFQSKCKLINWYTQVNRMAGYNNHPIAEFSNAKQKHHFLWLYWSNIQFVLEYKRLMCQMANVLYLWNCVNQWRTLTNCSTFFGVNKGFQESQRTKNIVNVVVIVINNKRLVQFRSLVFNLFLFLSLSFVRSKLQFKWRLLHKAMEGITANLFVNSHKLLNESNFEMHLNRIQIVPSFRVVSTYSSGFKWIYMRTIAHPDYTRPIWFQM